MLLHVGDHVTHALGHGLALHVALDAQLLDGLLLLRDARHGSMLVTEGGDTVSVTAFNREDRTDCFTACGSRFTCYGLRIASRLIIMIYLPFAALRNIRQSELPKIEQEEATLKCTVALAFRRFSLICKCDSITTATCLIVLSHSHCHTAMLIVESICPSNHLQFFRSNLTVANLSTSTLPFIMQSKCINSIKTI